MQQLAQSFHDDVTIDINQCADLTDDADTGGGQNIQWRGAETHGGVSREDDSTEPEEDKSVSVDEPEFAMSHCGNALGRRWSVL